MTRAEVVKVEGFAELGKAFDQLSESTARNTAKRVLKKAGQPVYDHFQSIAPRSNAAENHMADSGGVSPKLSKSQKRGQNKIKERSFAEMFIGPGPAPRALFQEFGTVNHPAQPSLTPAWEANKRGVLASIRKDLGREIIKSAKRLAAKAARKRVTA